MIFRQNQASGIEVPQCGMRIRIEKRHIPVNFRFLHRQVGRVRLRREFGEFPRPSLKLIFPVEGHGPKDSIIQLGGAFLRSRNRFQIFRASAFLISHQRIGGSDADLRGVEGRIDLQRFSIMIQSGRIITQHAHDLAVGILRVGLGRQRCDVLIHQRRRQARLPAQRVAVREIIQRRKIIRIISQDILENFLAVLVGILIRAQPLGGLICEPFVVRILREQIVHRGDSRNESSILRAIHPANQQTFIRRRVRYIFLCQSVFSPFFERIGCEVSQCGVAQRKARIGFHSFAQGNKPFVNKQQVFVVQQRQLVIVPCVRRGSRHRNYLRRRRPVGRCVRGDSGFLRLRACRSNSSAGDC